MRCLQANTSNLYILRRTGARSPSVLPATTMQRVRLLVSISHPTLTQILRFLKLGLQGTSIFVASGDTGVGGIPGDGAPNGCLGPNATVFSPTQPNSCPWLTNVGATKVYPGRTVFEPESAVVDPPGMPYRGAYSSGGGFSNIFPIPDYQADAVATFFQDHNPPYPYYEGGENLGANGGLYNRQGRGIPDVAANGDNIAVYVRGAFRLSGGTSASMSPTFFLTSQFTTILFYAQLTYP